MQYEIKITGSGTQNQLATRLLDLGRQLQLAENESEVVGTFDDDCLITVITGY